MKPKHKILIFTEKKMETHIRLGHGSGGLLTEELIKSIFVKHFSNDHLQALADSSILQTAGYNIAFTTDSYVVDPLFFMGGNIGKLAVCGTVNDLAVSGAKPLYLSSSFIIEEGLPISVLEEVVKTMAEEARKAGVMIVTGDTKVVDKGKCDKLFINTSGVGIIDKEAKNLSSCLRIKVGDNIIINGSIADHGMAVLVARNDLKIEANIMSDSACLHKMISAAMLAAPAGIHFMRDVTRGGLATVAAECAKSTGLGIALYEEHIPISDTTRGICEILGFDPLYVANEGKVLMIVSDDSTQAVLNALKSTEEGREAAVIGKVKEDNKGRVVLHTISGGSRIVDMLAGEQLPRIC